MTACFTTYPNATMKIRLGRHNAPDFPHGAAVTIGNFDGVHLGHKHILQNSASKPIRADYPSWPSFSNPNPKNFSHSVPAKPALPYQPLRTKLELLEGTGCVDAAWVLRFDRNFPKYPRKHLSTACCVKP
ncbi:bifunctional riboflavin kinase/FMN adenylyltransferase [Neisseria gonorrhoeae]|uniref:FAD synthase n=1 Tax=Neisseria gonorrhoeae TaxID=485 RepID=A0A378W2X3_NEIGO|nr:bifunctional riboflavin kinase/FMN adenylyltransferase [Neisseria gonorrhoeae]